MPNSVQNIILSDDLLIRQKKTQMRVSKGHTLKNGLIFDFMHLQANGGKLGLMHCSLGRSTEAKEQSLTTCERRLNAVLKPIEVRMSA